MRKTSNRITLRSELLILLSLVAMVFWFNDGIVRGGRVPFFRDLGPILYPMRLSLAKSLLAGELPLWNRHLSMGFPLLANFESGAFYPLHTVFLVLPFFAAIRFLFVAHYLVAASGSYFLCRQWKCPPHLALLGSVLFTFGGVIVSLSNLLAFFQTAVWLPWCLYAWERCLRRQSWSNFLVFVAVVLIQFLAGSPEIFAMSLALLFLDGLRLKAEEANITYRKVLALFLAAITLVAGIAMIQILPTAELFFESRAQKIIPYSDSVYWSLHPMELINLFFLDREVDPSFIKGMRLFFSQEIPLLISLYIGVIFFPAICLWLWKSSLNERVLLLFLVAISLILAMGRYTPVYSYLFDYVPLFQLIRFPEKFFFLTHAFLLLIAIRGLNHFPESENSSSRGLFYIVLSICLLFALPYLVLRFKVEPLIRFIAWAVDAPLASTSTLHRASAVLVHLERQVILTVGFFLVLFFNKKGWLRASVFKTLFVVIVFIDLASAHQPYMYLLDPEFVYKSARIIPVPDSEPSRLFYYPGSSDLHPSYYSLLREPPFADSTALLFRNLLPNTGVFYGFDYMQEMDSLARWPYVVFLGIAQQVAPYQLYRLLGIMNVRYIYSFRPLPGEGITLVSHFPEFPSWLYRNHRKVPSVYVVPEVSE
jgi:hypothetical protein